MPAGRLYATLDDALAAAGGDADFVMDATPPAVHASVAMRAFAAGLHLLGEKPLSDDFAAARRMVEAGQRAGKRHMVTQNYRFKPQPRTTRRLIEEGLIGPPGQVDIALLLPWADSPGSHYVTQPYMFLKDMSVHHFDMLRYILGRDPLSVRCVTWKPPWGWHRGDAAHVAIFTFEGGVRAVHRGVGCAVGTQTSLNGDWRIEGPLGAVTWEKDDLYYTHLHRTDRPRREQLFPDRVAPSPDVLLDEYVAAIREGREPECNAADNLRSLAMVEGCLRSAEAGGADIPLTALYA
jgi:predicted dehydrogenase